MAESIPVLEVAGCICFALAVFFTVGFIGLLSIGPDENNKGFETLFGLGYFILLSLAGLGVLALGCIEESGFDNAIRCNAEDGQSKFYHRHRKTLRFYVAMSLCFCIFVAVLTLFAVITSLARSHIWRSRGHRFRMMFSGGVLVTVPVAWCAVALRLISDEYFRKRGCFKRASAAHPTDHVSLGQRSENLCHVVRKEKADLTYTRFAKTRAPTMGAVTVKAEARVAETKCSPKPKTVKLGAATLAEILDEQTLACLQDCLSTTPDWLGKGRDLRGSADEGASSHISPNENYSKLLLVKAWQIENDLVESRYSLARQEIKQHADVISLSHDLPEVCLQSARFASDLGIALETDLNESIAFHGTSASALSSILNSGLNERVSSGHFGEGTYLADDAGKSDQYCEVELGKTDCALHNALYPEDADHPGNVCYLLVCQIILGRPAVTLDGKRASDGSDIWLNAASRRELAVIPGTDPPVSYHALVVEPGEALKNYREIVSFHSERILVKFLIAYKRVLSTRASGKLMKVTVKYLD